MNSYKLKYLKYKKKYLNLLSKYGKKPQNTITNYRTFAEVLSENMVSSNVPTNTLINSLNTLNLDKIDLDKQYSNFDYKFWEPLFSSSDLDNIKSFILSKQGNSNDLYKLINKMFNGFLFSNKINYINDTISRLPTNIDEIKFLSCIIFLLVGIVSYKLTITKQDYILMLKGGKTIQMLLSSPSNIYNRKYESDDIDFIIFPKEGVSYNETRVKNLALNFANLVVWIINDYKISIKPFEKDTHKIIKISYIENSVLNQYFAVSDIDYSFITEDKLKYYQNYITERKKITITNKIIDLYFYHQHISNILFEKIFYLSEYIKLFENLCMIIVNEFYKINNENPGLETKESILNELWKNSYYRKIYLDITNYKRIIYKFSKQTKLLLDLSYFIDTYPKDKRSDNNRPSYEIHKVNNYLGTLLTITGFQVEETLYGFTIYNYIFNLDKVFEMIGL